MDFFDLFAKIRAEWPTVSAAPTIFFVTLLTGLALGWAAAWVVLHQRLAHHKELIEHYKSVLKDGVPNFRVQNGESRLGTLGTILIIGGLVALVAGIAFVLISRAQANTGQLSLPLHRPSEQSQNVPVAEVVRQPPRALVPTPVVEKEVPPKAEPKAEPRVFTDVTIDQLIGFYDTRTSIQGDALVAVHIGKWIKTEGLVSNVSDLGTGDPRTIVHLRTKKRNLLAATFDGKQAERAMHLTMGSEVTIIGQLKYAESLAVTLQHCELT